MIDEFEFTAIPWIPHAAKIFLDGIVQPLWKVYEYGSGNSTLYFSRHDCNVMSIEHDAEWFAEVSGQLHAIEEDIDRAFFTTTRYYPLKELVLGIDPANPLHYFEPSFDGNFQEYAQHIEQYAARTFDLVFVDGVARPSCMLHSHAKVKPGGYLLLDNSEREYYLDEIAHLFEGWERYTFWGYGPINPYPWECSIWRKPLRRDK